MAQNSNENSDINNLQNSIDDYEEINENEEELKQNNRDSSIKDEKENIICTSWIQFWRYRI